MPDGVPFFLCFVSQTFLFCFECLVAILQHPRCMREFVYS
jgi:hypothetical protein